MNWRLPIVASLLGAVMYGEDLTVPLDGGSLIIRASFIRSNGYGSNVPELAVAIENRTPSPWRTLRLQFDIGGLCNGEPHQWTVPILTSLGWLEDHPVVKEYKETVIPLVGKVDGCQAEIIKAGVTLAENSTTRITGTAGERVDFQRELQEIKIKRDTEAAARAEEERKSAAAKQKRDEEEAARWERIAAEQSRKDAEERRKEAEERRKARAACAVVYRATVDKKIADLTVREETQIRACQALGLYPPE